MRQKISNHKDKGITKSKLVQRPEVLEAGEEWDAQGQGCIVSISCVLCAWRSAMSVEIDPLILSVNVNSRLTPSIRLMEIKNQYQVQLLFMCKQPGLVGGLNGVRVMKEFQSPTLPR